MLKRSAKIFKIISEYSDVYDILMLAKISDFSIYKKCLKKQLKKLLYEVCNCFINNLI